MFKEKSLFLHSQNKEQCQKEHFNLQIEKEEINMAFAKEWPVWMVVKYSKEEGQKEEKDWLFLTKWNNGSIRKSF